MSDLVERVRPLCLQFGRRDDRLPGDDHLGLHLLGGGDRDGELLLDPAE